jgi:tetratricopeptide (TPR) repeat protein
VKALEDKLRHPLHAQGFLFFLGLLTWFGVIHGGIVTHDTAWLMRDNPILSSGELNWLPTIWWDFSFDIRHTLGAEFLPVRDTDILIDFMLFGDNWGIHHMGNLMWYLLGCGLFLGICRHLLGTGLASWTAAALFCVHPVHGENIAWLAGRKDLLGMAFFLAAWWLWLRRKNQGRAAPLVFLLFVVGVWSKNTTIVLPAVLLLCDLTVHQKAFSKRLGHWLLWALVALPLLLLSAGLGRQMRLFGEAQHSSTLDGATLQMQLWAADLGRLFWPKDLALAYPIPDSGQAGALVLAVTLVGGLWVVAWRFRRIAPGLSLGIGLFFICALPTNVFNDLQNLSADRYLLLPSMGIALFLGTLLRLEALTSRRRLQFACLLALLPLALLSQQQSRVWKSDLQLWAASASAQPEVLQNVTGHARALRDAGQADLAISLLNMAEERFSKAAKFYQSRGAIHLKRKDLKAAEADYRHALDLNPELRISGNDLAFILSRTGRLDEAIPIAQRVTQSHPLYAKGFNTLGALLLDARQLDAAETALLQAEYLSYQDANAACNLGSVFWLKMQEDPAARPSAEWWWSICKRRDPSTPTPPGLSLTP